MSEPEFRARLVQEIDAWQRSGLITDDQAKAIRALQEGPERFPRRGLARILTLLGAIFVGAGMIAVVAANWAELSGAAKLGLLVASMLAAYYGGYRLRYGGTTYQGTGNALIFLGTWLYGATIFLVAQGFHVNAGAPSLLVLWSVGVLPLAYLLRSRAHLTLSLVPLGIALGTEVFSWLDDSWRADQFFWIFVVYGVLLHAIGRHHARTRTLAELAGPYTSVGLMIVLAALLPMTFPGISEVDEGHPGYLPAGVVIRLLVLAGLALATVAGGAWRGRSEPIARWVDAVSAGLIILAVALIFAAPLPGAALVANGLYLALLVGVVALGLATRDRNALQMGLFFFTILIGCRYVDLLWDAMPRELFLIGAGVLLLVGGMLLERTRRRLLGQLEATDMAEELL